VLERGPLRASFEVKFSIGNKSSLTQVVSLTAVSGLIEFDTQVDWHEGTMSERACRSLSIALN